VIGTTSRGRESVEVTRQVRKVMKNWPTFPHDLSYSVFFDTTVFALDRA